MSCVQEKCSNQWISDDVFFIGIEPTRSFKLAKHAPFIALLYKQTTYKRIRLKVQLMIRAVGQYPFQQCRCVTGYGIDRLVIWIKDPFSEILKLLDIIVQLQIIMNMMNMIGVIS